MSVLLAYRVIVIDMSDLIEKAGLAGGYERKEICGMALEHIDHDFANPFQLEDLLIFDRQNLERVLKIAKVGPQHLAWSVQGDSEQLVQRLLACLPIAIRPVFLSELSHCVAREKVELARHILLDKLFWELTYWKTPELYDELVQGEHLHPGIFRQLAPLIHDKIVLDAGAGSGRASFEALHYGARLVYALEPSPGLRHLLAQKLSSSPVPRAVVLCAGDFAHVPLPDQSVDLVLTCSAFTAEPEQGGEPGLAEFKRVTCPGGYIVVIWPRCEDYHWLAEQGFQYVALSQEKEMSVEFASWRSAWRCVQRFYAHKQDVHDYLSKARHPRLPFSILGFHAPCDYSWFQVR
jgi:SAM-dependent methyltransferase